MTVENFFDPRGIALIGATANTAKGGHAILFNLQRGYTGAIHPVNPIYEEINGLPCYRSVKEVPDPVDLAIVFVPAERVAQVVAECGERGIAAVMVQSAGFAEGGEGGRKRQAELLEISRRSGIRIWGPNCMGLVDAHRRFVFSFAWRALWDSGLSAGPVSLVVQSGLLAAGYLIDFLSHGTMDISKACSIGNKSDVDECDVLAYLLDDPQTGAVALYLESITDGRRFVELCRAASKPIVVLKGGQSARGAAAAMSHTASMAGDGAVVSGVLAQAGVVEARDFGQMLDMARTLACYPQIRYDNTPRVGVMTYSGAAGIVSADFIDRNGLEMAKLASRTIASLEVLFPDWMPVGNPVDLWPAIETNGSQKAYREALKALCDDPAVDLIVLHLFVGVGFTSGDLPALVKITRQANKPLFCWVLGVQDEVKRFVRAAQELGVPVYREVGRSIECIAALNRPPEIDRRTPPLVVEKGAALDDECQRLLRTGQGALDEYRSKRLLSQIGVPTVAEAIVKTCAEALTAAGQIGYPVVLKGLMAGTVHKTEAGLVRLGIQSDAQLEQAFSGLSADAPETSRYLIQRQIPGEIELIAGLVRDRQFGPCVMCGLGGVFAEALADRVFALAPLSRDDALAMIGRLKSRRLLDGWRGQAPLDKPALADILVGLAALGCASDRIQEIDINPLIISAGQPIAVDATIILADEQK